MRVELASIFASALLAAGCAQESPALVGAWRSTLRYEPIDAQGRRADGGGTAKGRAVRVGF